MHLIPYATSLGILWLRHVAKEHGGSHDVLASSGEVVDKALGLPILSDLLEDFSGPTSSPCAAWGPVALLENLRKLGLQFLELCKLHGLVALGKAWIDLIRRLLLLLGGHAVASHRRCCSGSITIDGVIV